MKIAEMTWKDFENAGSSLALLPTGSTEQHGPHGPMGTDTLIAEAIASRSAEETESFLLPTIHIGVSREHAEFPGTLYLPPKVFRSQLKETILSAYNSDIDKFIVVNGHGGNISSIQEICRVLDYNYDMTAVEWTWFKAIESSSRMGHAGKLETSLILYLREELINDSAEQGADSWGKELYGARIDYDAKKFTKNGVVGDPTRATRKKGEELFNKASKKLTKLIKSLSN